MIKLTEELSPEEIAVIMKAFWAKYASKGLTPGEVVELHFAEQWQSVTKAQLSKSEQEANEQMKAELRKVKEEIEDLCTEYINSGTAISGQYKLQIDPQKLALYWKEKGV